MVAFAHFCSTRNIGDKVSAPYLYFDFPNAEFFDLRSPLPPREIFIYGGGAVRNELENQNSLFPAALKIAWASATRFTAQQHRGLSRPASGFMVLANGGSHTPAMYLVQVACRHCLIEAMQWSTRPSFF